MKYVSTRNNNLIVSGSEAVLTGLAPDGGLFVPQTFSQITREELEKMTEMDYPERSALVMSKFFDELTYDELLDVTTRAYATFDGDPAPEVKLDDGLYVLELWHGKTHAFKDMALSVLPLLMTALKKKVGQSETCLIPVATSGDTGKAALEGFSGVEGTGVIVFYPDGGVSNAQKKQMVTTLGDNVKVVAVKGNFDDAQTAVKKAFGDEDLKKKLASIGCKMTGANSINLGRLAPQVAYYVSAYVDILGANRIEYGEEVDFCVPTGNFGNILAAYYAKMMGVPVGRLVCASNDNNVLADFLASGVYSLDRPFIKTSSPSMDILISSNLERLLFEVAGRDSALVCEWMKDLKEKGSYDIGGERLFEIRKTFVGGYATQDECADTLADVFDEYGYLCDPHTAVAFDVCFQYEEECEPDNPIVVVSTASPVKFANTVLESLGLSAPESDVKALRKMEDETAFPVPDSVYALFDMEERFSEVIEPKELNDTVYKFAESIK
ncbi:MAG: threonine synthase [Clostridia bacterium]|nr:threonine synthase [Clostridia bacterium]